MNRYSSEGFTKEEVLQKIDEKKREIVYFDSEINSAEEDLLMLELELERIEEEE